MNIKNKKNILITQTDEITNRICNWTRVQNQIYLSMLTIFFDAKIDLENRKGVQNISFDDFNSIRYIKLNIKNFPKLRVDEMDKALKNIFCDFFQVGLSGDNSDWTAFRIIERVDYVHYKGEFNIKLTDSFYEYYILNTKKSFLVYNPLIPIQFDYMYSLRFFEFITKHTQGKYTGSFFLNYQDFREQNKLNNLINKESGEIYNLYNKYSAFEEKVIQKVLSDFRKLFDKGDLDFYLEYEKKLTREKKNWIEKNPKLLYFSLKRNNDNKHCDKQNPKQQKSLTNMNVTEQTSEIIQTRVTDAVKYLFFDLKHNKDVSRLNQIITYVDNNLPENYPIENLQTIMDNFFDNLLDLKKPHREIAPINERMLVKHIVNYNNNLMPNNSDVSEYEKKMREGKTVRLKEELNYFVKGWEIVFHHYKSVWRINQNISDVDGQTVDHMYYILFSSNRRGEYFSLDFFTRLPHTFYSEKWKKETCDRADYVARFFYLVESVETLHDIYHKVCEKTSKEMNIGLEIVKCLKL